MYRRSDSGRSQIAGSACAPDGGANTSAPGSSAAAPGGMAGSSASAATNSIAALGLLSPAAAGAPQADPALRAAFIHARQAEAGPGYHVSVIEEYVNGPLGVEQSFDIAA